MSKITINEYAKKHQITRQTVYNRVKSGLLEAIEEDGVTLIYDEDIEVSNNNNIDCQKLVKKLYKRIDKLEKQNDKLQARLEAEQDKNSSLILSYVEEMKALYLPAPKKAKKKKKK